MKKHDCPHCGAKQETEVELASRVTEPDAAGEIRTGYQSTCTGCSAVYEVHLVAGAGGVKCEPKPSSASAIEALQRNGIADAAVSVAASDSAAAADAAVTAVVDAVETTLPESLLAQIHHTVRKEHGQEAARAAVAEWDEQRDAERQAEHAGRREAALAAIREAAGGKPAEE